MKRIVYPNGNGGVVILIPSSNMDLSIEQIAKKDVPKDLPYKIINTEDVPTDRTFRNAWEMDFTSFDGIGGTE